MMKVVQESFRKTASIIMDDFSDHYCERNQMIDDEGG